MTIETIVADESDGQGIACGFRHITSILGKLTIPVEGSARAGLYQAAIHHHSFAEGGDEALKCHVGARGIEGIQDQHHDRRIQKEIHQNRGGDADKRRAAKRVHADHDLLSESKFARIEICDDQCHDHQDQGGGGAEGRVTRVQELPLDQIADQDDLPPAQDVRDDECSHHRDEDQDRPGHHARHGQAEV